MAKQMVSEKSTTMKSRLRQAVGGGASMVPSDPAPPPSMEEEVVPQLKELIDSLKERRSFTALVESYLAYSEDAKIADAAKKRISTEMKKVVGSYGISRVMVEGNLVNYFNAPRSTIKQDLLLAAGVSPKIINECTEVKNAYTLRITPPKE